MTTWSMKTADEVVEDVVAEADREASARAAIKRDRENGTGAFALSPQREPRIVFYDPSKVVVTFNGIPLTGWVQPLPLLRVSGRKRRAQIRIERRARKRRRGWA